MAPSEAALGSALEFTRLNMLMQLTSGDPRVAIGLIDGPVAMTLPELADVVIREISVGGHCSRTGSEACEHGTFVAAMLVARRDSVALGICPACSLLVRSIFPETGSVERSMPSAHPNGLALAIIDTVDAGARVLNISAALTQAELQSERKVSDALTYAAQRGVLVVAAAGNQASIGSSIITRHPSVIPVVGCDLKGRPTNESNLGGSIGRKGLRAPGESVTSLGPAGQSLVFRGTSVAAPFVTGTIALLWSEFPEANAAAIRSAVTQSSSGQRRTINPPILDAWGAYQRLNDARARRTVS
jgi:subtilisin family serine protease